MYYLLLQMPILFVYVTLMQQYNKISYFSNSSR